MAVTATAVDAVAARRSVPGQLSTPSLLALSLVPGALLALAFVGAAPIAQQLGFPPIAALLAGIVLVLVPVELGTVLYASRGTGSRWSAVGYRDAMALRSWLWLVPALVLAAFVGFGLSAAIEPQVIRSLFGWLPAWFVTPIAFDRVADYSRTAWTVTFVVFFVVNGLLGPVVEEVYFRGYLLPRMERFGRWAALVNVTLFSLYHLWSPWQVVARILGFGPTVYAVRAKRNIYLGMLVHATLNSLSVFLVAQAVFARMS
jgi:uncharacterized protein